jgi:mannose/fructose-specific phosphotransferase system component IIA
MSSVAPPGPRALVAGHGDFAAGIVSAAVQITGRADAFSTLSNRELCTADVEQCMRELVEREGVRVIFTDLHAGSCAMAARRLQRERPDLIVVTGTNLATLLEWTFLGDGADAEGVRRAVEKGSSSLRALSGAASPSRDAEGPGGR